MRCKYFGQCGGDSCSRCLIGIEETKKQALRVLIGSDQLLHDFRGRKYPDKAVSHVRQASSN